MNLRCVSRNSPRGQQGRQHIVQRGAPVGDLKGLRSHTERDEIDQNQPHQNSDLSGGKRKGQLAYHDALVTMRRGYTN